MQRKFSVVLTMILLAVNISVCAKSKEDIVIYYDNDVHCETSGYAKISALRDESRAERKYSSIVSCGDYAQGGVIGAYYLGESIVEIMNEAGYDVATIGNHEFDYGVQQLMKLTGELKAKTVCANFINLKTNQRVFDPYTIVDYGDTKVAYIGVITPNTISSSSPIFFMENGEYIYDFSKDTFYDLVQENVDAARAEGADYVVLLSHLGITPSNQGITSALTVENTTGIDVVIDGHEHSIIPSATYKNKNGEDVTLTSSGTKFANIGKVVISGDGDIKTELIRAQTVTVESENVTKLIDELTVDDYYVGYSDVVLSDCDENGLRVTRRKESGLGNFIADAFRTITNTDIAMINGGGIRAAIPAGEITFNSIYKVFPFENVPYCVAASGQKVIDILEYGLAKYPYEFGGFMNISGIRYKLDPSIKSCVVRDGDGMFVKFEGERRISDVEVLNKETNEYEPIDLDKTYSISTLDYSARKNGDGNTLFSDCELITAGGMLDTDLIRMYVDDYCEGTIPERYTKTEGRITIVGAEENKLSLRSAFENSGFTVEWSEAAPDDVVVSKDNCRFLFTDNSDCLTYNGTEYNLEKPAYIDDTNITRICPAVYEMVMELYGLSLR